MATTNHRSTRYESLDAWRGFACLLVVIFHATAFNLTANLREVSSSFPGSIILLMSYLYHGVTLFFVISGYCIAAAVEASARRDLPMANFFWRRFRRIFPPFWVLVALAAILAGVGHAAHAGRFFWEVPASGASEFRRAADLSGRQWLGNLTLTESWLPGLLGRTPRLLEGTGHAWTLAYEEQFYAISGLLLVLSRRNMNRFFAGAAVVTLLTFGVGASPALQSRLSGVFLDGHWIMFACGIAVYRDRAHAGLWEQRAIRGVLALLCLTGLAMRPISLSLVICTAFALVLIALQRFDAAWASARVPRLFWWCGTRCYSLYLVHWPLTRPLERVLFEYGVRSPWASLLITLPVCVGASLAAAWAFHALVERRFLNRADAYSAAGREERSRDRLPVAVGRSTVLAG
jgi:peptidoglycan/LPS O-acetylase OafA/YrhL